jgi:hypothetical protein
MKKSLKYIHTQSDSLSQLERQTLKRHLLPRHASSQLAYLFSFILEPRNIWRHSQSTLVDLLQVVDKHFPWLARRLDLNVLAGHFTFSVI